MIELFFGVVALMICWKAKIGIVSRFVAGFAATLLIGVGLKDMTTDSTFWIVASVVVVFALIVITAKTLRSRRKRAEESARDDAYRRSQYRYPPVS
jgi:phosphotransferase system  glucose/maltose/N-acetylglucosamine-specific IIC component